MDDTGMDSLYSQFCNYARELNEALHLQVPRCPPFTPASRSQFHAIWNSLSAAHREQWRLKFDVGFQEVSTMQCRKLAAALLSGQADSRSSGGRAA